MLLCWDCRRVFVRCRLPLALAAAVEKAAQVDERKVCLPLWFVVHRVPKRRITGVIVVLRKASVVVVSVFGILAGVEDQTLLTIVVLFLFLLLHIMMRPFDTADAHQHVLLVESGALSVCFLTMWSGLVFFRGKLDGDAAVCDCRVYAQHVVHGLGPEASHLGNHVRERFEVLLGEPGAGIRSSPLAKQSTSGNCTEACPASFGGRENGKKYLHVENNVSGSEAAYFTSHCLRRKRRAAKKEP